MLYGCLTDGGQLDKDTAIIRFEHSQNEALAQK